MDDSNYHLTLIRNQPGKLLISKLFQMHEKNI
jgi:hypothetical protein